MQQAGGLCQGQHARSHLHAQQTGRPSTAAVPVRRRCRVQRQVGTCSGNGELQKLHTKVCIVGSGPAAHTAAIYLARAELEPVMFEGWMANNVAPGGQLTTTTYIENFPGFISILGIDLTDKFRQHSVHYGTRVFTETVERLDLRHGPPYKLWTNFREVEADSVIIATGASARKLPIPGLDTYWNAGISACAVCDGSSPLFRNKPLVVVGGGDVAMEEATFLTRYASKVYIVHRFSYLEASKLMARRALSNPKIEVLWETEVVEALGNEEGVLDRVVLLSKSTDQQSELAVSGLFFAVGHLPATAFLEGQLALDDYGYIETAHDSTATSVPGVFAAGDCQDRKWRQAITSAGSGCMAALEVERYLQDLNPAPVSSMDAPLTQDGFSAAQQAAAAEARVEATTSSSAMAGAGGES